MTSREVMGKEGKGEEMKERKGKERKLMEGKEREKKRILRK